MIQDEEEIDLGTEDDAENVALEEKYAEQMRQIFPQKIELPISTLVNMVETQIDLSPEFQRRDVWDQRKQAKFIESLIMNVPIPSVFMGEDKYGKYEVLDGRQRLTAIVAYLQNKYELIKLEVWSELNGKRFSDLKEMELDVTITRRFLPAVVLLKESSPQVKYDVFERLNTGGLNLKPMEIRNAVYRGQFTELLHRCADHKIFRRLWNIPESNQERKKNRTYARMEDLELVLRFFALGKAQKQPETQRPAFKTYLGIFMQQQNALFEQDASLVEKEFDRFERAITNCHDVLGEHAFQRIGKRDRSAPFADALMYGLAELDTKEKDVDKMKSVVQRAVAALQTDNEAFQDAMATGTNGKAKIETRLREARNAINEAIEAGH